MKKLNIISGLLVAMLSSSAHAISVGGLELGALLNNVSTASGNFMNYNSVVSTDVINLNQIRADLTDANPASYVLSVDAGAYINMGFSGANTVYNGAGDDLAFFFFGDKDTFSIEINGFTNSYSPQTTPTPWTVTDPWGTRNLTVALIELDDFGMANSQQALKEFKVFFGDPSRPALSLVGGFHTSAMSAAVPLPLPALLFVSGLGMLGAISRRRKQA